MIINGSRKKSASSCWRKAFNLYHRGIEGPRSMDLVSGISVHAANAVGMASGDWKAAKDAAFETFSKEVEKAAIPDEQSWIVEEHWHVILKVVELYEANYPHAEWTLIQPECEFDVALPSSQHSCVFIHWFDLEDGVERWGAPPPDKILRKSVRRAHLTAAAARRCKCWVPHRYVGRTDALILNHGHVWLLDHKTTSLSIEGAQFWDQFLLDDQLTGYLWGIEQALGVSPHGFIINAVHRPSNRQVQAYNARRKDGELREASYYVDYARQSFHREEADLWRFERSLVEFCNEWELRVLGELEFRPVLNSNACILYNRRCDYHTACLTHEESGTLEALAMRDVDYVDERRAEQLVQLLAKQPPAPTFKSDSVVAQPQEYRA